MKKERLPNTNRDRTNIIMRSLVSLVLAAGAFTLVSAQVDTELDIQVSRINAAQANLFRLSQMVDALAAQLQQQTAFLEELEKVDAPKLNGTDLRQDVTIDNRQAAIDATNMRIDQTLRPLVAAVGLLREGNHNLTNDNANALARQLGDNLDRSRMAADVLNAIRAQKDKLERETANIFRQLRGEVETEHKRINATRQQETRFRCEVGRVTLKHDDRQVTYNFQTPFNDVPGIVHGLCGYNFRVNPDSTPGGQPQAMGVRSVVFPSRDAVTVSVQDGSFGDADLIDATVCFQACSIPR